MNKILIIVLFQLLGIKILYTQKDSLYVKNHDTLTFVIDQKLPTTIIWESDRTTNEVEITLHLLTNSKNNTYLEKVSTGDGPLVFYSDFNNSIGGIVKFKDGHCYGKLVYSIDSNTDKLLKRKTVTFKITESNNGLKTYHQSFSFIGKFID